MNFLYLLVSLSFQVHLVKVESYFKKELDRLKDGVFRMTPSIDLTPFMVMRYIEDIKTYFPQAFFDVTKVDQKNQKIWPLVNPLSID